MFTEFKDLINKSALFKDFYMDNKIEYESIDSFWKENQWMRYPLSTHSAQNKYNQLYNETGTTSKILFDDLLENDTTIKYQDTSNPLHTFSIDQVALVPMIIAGLPLKGLVKKPENNAILTVTMTLPKLIFKQHLEQMTKIIAGFFFEYQIKWEKDDITVYVNDETFQKLLKNMGKNIQGIYDIIINDFKNTDFVTDDSNLKNKKFSLQAAECEKCASNVNNDDIIYDSENNVIFLAIDKDNRWDFNFMYPDKSYFYVKGIFKNKSLKIIKKEK